MKIFIGCEVHQEQHWDSDDSYYNVPVVSATTQAGAEIELWKYKKKDLIDAANYLRPYGGYMEEEANDFMKAAENMTVNDFKRIYMEKNDDFTIIEMELVGNF